MFAMHTFLLAHRGQLPLGYDGHFNVRSLEFIFKKYI